jgi:hypothetical protein
MTEIVDTLVKEHQAKKLYNRVRDELGYSFDCCDEFVNLVEDWLPNHNLLLGQNVDAESTVDGFNDCVRNEGDATMNILFAAVGGPYCFYCWCRTMTERNFK